MYEYDGSVFNYQGKLRRFFKVLTAPKNTISLKLFFLTFVRYHSFYN